MQNHYEINISLNGQHFFATAERSCTSEKQAKKVYFELLKRFPIEEGFKISITKWDCLGHIIEF